MKRTMGSLSFRNKIKEGDEGERLWEKHLVSMGQSVIRSSDVKPPNKRLYWDLEISESTADKHKNTRFEVKYDTSGYEYMHRRGSEYPNLFIEWMSLTTGKKCGIYSSIGEADIFVYIFKKTSPSGEHLGDYAHVFYLEDFAVWVDDIGGKRHGWKDVPCNVKGDNNARGWLVPEKVVLDTAHTNGHIKTISLT